MGLARFAKSHRSPHVLKPCHGLSIAPQPELKQELAATTLSFAVTSVDKSARLRILSYLWRHVAEAGYQVSVYTGGNAREGGEEAAQATLQPGPLAHGIGHVQLEGVQDFDYPPVMKNFRAWQHLISRTRAAWYARCDDDTFVNAAALASALRAFGDAPIFTGALGDGRTHDRQKFNITFRYAQGGTCEFLSAAAAQIIVKELPGCLERSQRAFATLPDMHSDVELGRCLVHHGLNFTSHPQGRAIFRSVATANLVHTARLPSLDLEQLLLRWQQGNSCMEPLLALGPAGMQTTFGSLHPIKDAHVAIYLSEFARGLTPIPSRLVSNAQRRKRALSFARSSLCAHNPAALSWTTACCNRKLFFRHFDTLNTVENLQIVCMIDNCSLIVPECPVGVATTSVLSAAMFASVHAVILTMESRAPLARRMARGMSRLLQLPARRPFHVLQAPIGAHVHHVAIDLLTPGEMGLRDGLRIAVMEAITANASALLFVEDDAIPRIDFAVRWTDLLASQRCFGFLRQPGGILLLGASEWSNQFPNELFYDELRKPICYNALSNTCGTFTMLLSRHVLPAVLDWLANSNQPIDHVFQYIIMRGFPVRVAHPYLFVADLNKTSAVNPWRLRRSLVRNFAVRGWGDPSQYKPTWD